ncbi:25339_t:CDS:2, partial [Dentiscutata erythropus]
MSIGIGDQVEYIPISCKQQIEDPNTVYPINFKNLYSNQKLELKLENDELMEPIYTTIQVGNTFSQLDEQLIANIKIENVNNSLNPPPPDIFKLIQPEINEIKDKRKKAQKVPIHITEDKSTFIEHTLNNKTIVETYYKEDESFQEALLKRSFEIEDVLLKQQDEALENIQKAQKSQK